MLAAAAARARMAAEPPRPPEPKPFRPFDPDLERVRQALAAAAARPAPPPAKDRTPYDLASGPWWGVPLPPADRPSFKDQDLTDDHTLPLEAAPKP